MKDFIVGILVKKFGPSEYVNQYIELCSEQDFGPQIERHHILPRHEFPEFECLTLNPWNESKISYKKHVMAHYLYHRLSGTFNSWYALMCMINMRHAATRKSSITDEEILLYIESADTLRFREGLSEKMTLILKNPEIRKKISQGVKRSMTDDKRTKISESVTNRFKDDKFKDRHKEACGAIWESSELRERHRSSIIKAHSMMDDETRKSTTNKIKAAMRKGEHYKEENKRIIYDAWVCLGKPAQTKLHTHLMKTHPEFSEFIPSPNKLLRLVAEFRQYGYVVGL